MVAVGKRAIDLDVDAREFHRVLAMAKKFDRTFSTNLRRDLRAAAEVAAVDVRAEVRKPPMVVKKRTLRKATKVENGKGALAAPVDKKDTTHAHHLRARIAAGVKVQIAASAGSRRVGVFIVSRGSDDDSKTLKRSWDREKGWRHPVWQKGNRKDKWVTQYGRPYFGSQIEKHKPQIEAMVKKSLAQAVADVAEWDRWVAKHNATK